MKYRDKNISKLSRIRACAQGRDPPFQASLSTLWNVPSVHNWPRGAVSGSDQLFLDLISSDTALPFPHPPPCHLVVLFSPKIQLKEYLLLETSLIPYSHLISLACISLCVCLQDTEQDCYEHNIVRWLQGLIPELVPRPAGLFTLLLSEWLKLCKVFRSLGHFFLYKMRLIAAPS